MVDGRRWEGVRQIFKSLWAPLTTGCGLNLNDGGGG